MTNERCCCQEPWKLRLGVHRLTIPCPSNPPLPQTWVKARQASDFSLFAPALEKWVALRRERAALIDPGKPVYDVLLDDYQPGLTSARLDSIFDQVCACVMGWMGEVM